MAKKYTRLVVHFASPVTLEDKYLKLLDKILSIVVRENVPPGYRHWISTFGDADDDDNTFVISSSCIEKL